MHNNIHRFIIVSIFSFSIFYSEVNIPSDNYDSWEILQDDTIWIGWKHNGKFDWCRASSIVHASIEDVRKIIEDKERYPQVFKRIEKAEIITDEIVYIALDISKIFREIS